MGSALATAHIAALGDHYLVDPSAKAAQAGPVIKSFIAKSGPVVRLVLNVRASDVRLWSAEEPNLFTFIVTLIGGKV